MPKMNFNLSDEDTKRAAARASELGYSSVEAYLHSLISADLESPLPEELEVELLKALDKPSREIAPGDWQEKRRRLIEKHRQAKAG